MTETVPRCAKIVEEESRRNGYSERASRSRIAQASSR